MELTVGTKIRYSCSAGTLEATIRSIKIGPTAKPGYMNTWMTLDLPVQEGIKFATTTTIPANNECLKMFKVTPL